MSYCLICVFYYNPIISSYYFCDADFGINNLLPYVKVLLGYISSKKLIT